MSDRKPITKRMKAYRAFGEVFTYVFILILYNSNPRPIVFNGVIILSIIVAIIGIIWNIGRDHE